MLNLQALAERSIQSTAAINVRPSSSDLEAHLTSQAYAKARFMGLQNRHDGKHPDTMIKNFRELLNNMQDAMHCMAVYSGMWEMLKNQSHVKTYMFSEQLHSTELRVYHAINVQVDHLEGECRFLICR
jgi:hypothetical protein